MHGSGSSFFVSRTSAEQFYDKNAILLSFRSFKKGNF